MMSIAPISPEAIEAQCSVLRVYSSILSDFYDALVDARYPAEHATDLVHAWWTHYLEDSREDG